VDNGSLAGIIFADAFDKMGLNRDLLQPPDTPLYGFGVIHALGKVVLPVSFGTVQNARIEYLSFDVLEMYYPYNGILGRGFLNKFEAVIHQAYLCIKIPATPGVITMWGHQNDDRNLERGRTPSQRNAHALDEAVECNEAEKQPKADKEKINIQQTVKPNESHWMRWSSIRPSSSAPIYRLTRKQIYSFSSRRTKKCSHGPPKISQVLIEASSSTN
jgi:hypothetical protein